MKSAQEIYTLEAEGTLCLDAFLNPRAFESGLDRLIFVDTFNAIIYRLQNFDLDAPKSELAMRTAGLLSELLVAASKGQDVEYIEEDYLNSFKSLAKAERVRSLKQGQPLKILWGIPHVVGRRNEVAVFLAKDRTEVRKLARAAGLVGLGEPDHANSKHFRGGHFF